MTETWLRHHLDAELKIENYNLFRVDRSRAKKSRGRNSGGVAAYIKKNLDVEILHEYSSSVIESICLKIASMDLIVCGVYRQPDDIAGGHRSTSVQLAPFLDELDQVLSQLPKPTPNIILTGDFNMPHASWPAGSPTSGASLDEKKMLELISNFCTRHFLVQVVEEPTHRGGNTLDLLFTNSSDLFVDIESAPAEPVSSHHLIRFATRLASPSKVDRDYTPSENAFDRVNLQNNNTNWAQIKSMLASKNWTQSFENKSVTEMLNIMVSTCTELALKYSPPKTKRSRKSSTIPRHRRVLMRKRTKLRKLFNSTTQPERKRSIRARLVQIEESLQSSYRSQEHFDENKAVANIKANPKFFYSYAKKHGKASSPIGPLTDSTGKLDGSPQGMATILSNQYKSAFSTPMQIELSDSDQPESVIDDIVFDEADIIRAIDELKPNSAPGPDKFPAVLLKNCKHELAKPLFLIWRKSLNTGEIPDSLKLSNITPIYKDGNRKEPKNYRPVALTSHLSKLFEKVVRNALVKYIEERNLLNPNQHGFRRGYSCLSQLLHHQDAITQQLEHGLNVDVIYLDFSKAFDKLDINITLQKLLDLGVRGKLFVWLKSFMKNRQQCVVIDEAKSNKIPITSGVPQGSVLGPLLFLILLNDIDANVNFSSVSSFADDTRVYSGVHSTQDVCNLQTDLHSIYDWARKNNATFNAGKFECVRYGKNAEIKSLTSYISSNGTTIDSCDNVRDLGVQMSSDATFSHQIDKIVTSATKKCGWILRTFKTRERIAMITLWKSLIAPILDYCCQLWSPSKPGQITALENVQHSFFKKIAGTTGLDYWDLLKLLKMSSLQRRRERYICIYMWKIIEGLVPNFGIRFHYNRRRGRQCSVPQVCTTAPHRFQTIRFNSMGVHGPRLFNSLPVNIRNMAECSVDTFKAALDKHLDTVPDEPRVPRLVKYCQKSSNSLLEYK